MKRMILVSCFAILGAAVAAQETSYVLLNGKEEASLESALGKAQNGSVIELGTGEYVVPPGTQLVDLKISGVDAGKTVLVAQEPWGTTFKVMGDASLERLTVTGSAVGFEVESGLLDLKNVILRDYTDAAVRVTAPEGFVQMTLSTLHKNEIGIDVWDGGAMVTNTVFYENKTAVWTYTPTGREYNVYDKNVSDIEGEAMNPTERKVEARFVDPVAHDYRERDDSKTIDAGDPATSFDMEPPPNGKRVNVGAFGNTSMAAATTESDERSEPASATAAPARSSSGGGASGCAASIPDRGPAPALLAAIALAAGLALLRRN